MLYNTRCFRPSVKKLLNHEFFLDEPGMKIEYVEKEMATTTDIRIVNLQLKFLDAKKRKDKHKENEAIQFEFDIENDNPDKIAQMMVSIRKCCKGHILRFFFCLKSFN